MDSDIFDRIRTQALSLYRSGGIDGVRAWLEAESISVSTLQEAFADDAGALRIIDRELTGDASTPVDFETLLHDYLEHLRETRFYENARFTLTDHTHFYPVVDLIEAYTPLGGAQVLDYGSGAGGLLLPLVERGAACAVGVEVDYMLNRLAEARYRGRETQIRCTLSPTGSLPLPDASIDIVMSSHVIEHVPDQVYYMAEVVRVLAPGGVAFFLCPNRWWPFEPHGKFLLLPFLPKMLATSLCRWLQSGVQVGQRWRVPSCTKDLWHRLNASITVAHFMSPRSLERLARQAGLVPRVCNPPVRFPLLAPRLSTLLQRTGPLRGFLAYLLSPEILLVADKPRPSRTGH